eukprot:507328-Hanusia_phi.AAC.5
MGSPGPPGLMGPMGFRGQDACMTRCLFPQCLMSSPRPAWTIRSAWLERSHWHERRGRRTWRTRTAGTVDERVTEAGLLTALQGWSSRGAGSVRTQWRDRTERTQGLARSSSQQWW